MAVNETVNLTIRIRDEATKALTGARTGVERLNRGFETMKRSLFSLKGLLVGLGVGLAVRRIARDFNELSREIDLAAKNAKRFGVDLRTLTGLQFGAGLSGVSNEALGTGLRTLAKNAQDVAKGIGEAKDAFQLLGIEATDSSGRLKGVDVLLGEVADQFTRMRDGTEKAALAQRIFGRSGAELIPFLNEGSAGIKEMREEAERLGIVIDERTARAAERFQDGLTRMQSAIRGVKIELLGSGMQPAAIILEQMAVAIAENREEFARFTGDSIPRIKQMVTALGALAHAMNETARAPGVAIDGLNLLATRLALFEAEARQKMRELEGGAIGVVLNVQDAMERGAADGINFTVRAVEQGINRIIDLINQAQAKAGSTQLGRMILGKAGMSPIGGVQFGDLVDTSTLGVGQSIRRSLAMVGPGARGDEAQADAERLRRELNELTQSIVAQGEAAGRTREEIFGWIDSLHQMIDEATAAAGASDGLSGATERASESMRMSADDLERVNKLLFDYERALVAARLQTESFEEMQARIRGNRSFDPLLIGEGAHLGIMESAQAFNLGAQAADTMRSSVNRLHTDMAAAFEAMLDGSKGFKEAFGDFVRAFIANIMAMIAAMLAAIVVKAILFPFDLPFTTAAGSAAGSAAAGAAAGAAGAGIGISTQGGGGLTGISANEFARSGGGETIVYAPVVNNNISAVDAGSFKRMLTANPEALTPAMVQNFNSSLALQTVFRG